MLCKALRLIFRLSVKRRTLMRSRTRLTYGLILPNEGSQNWTFSDFFLLNHNKKSYFCHLHNRIAISIKFAKNQAAAVKSRGFLLSINYPIFASTS